MKAWARAFYLSNAWKKTRKEYLVSKHRLCERCEQPASIVHHKKYLTPNNINNTSVTLCWDNLEALCQECHNKEHHRNSEQRCYCFDEDGNIIAAQKKQ